MIETIQKELGSYNGNWKDKKGVWEFSAVIAERKAFLSSKKLTYSARVKIVDDEKAIHFSEMLIEAGSGLSSGGFDSDSGMSTGFGFKTESQKFLFRFCNWKTSGLGTIIVKKDCQV
ncbi:MAG: hypothetical protein WCP91_02170, partial [Candidatus Berkelbacteria bacterium]